MTSSDIPKTKPDQYGQEHPIETPEILAAKLKEFGVAVDAIPNKCKTTIYQAESKCPELLTDDFKLWFLRCELFDVKLAVERYQRYWDKRVQVFGPTKAFQPMTQAGAMADDLEGLECDYFRAIPSHDPSGRRIIFVDPSKQDHAKYSVETMLRAIQYTLHKAMEDDVTAQQKGFVIIVFPQNMKFAQLNRKLAKGFADTVKGCFPLRISAVHICHPPTFFRVIFPIIQMLMGERLRKRIRVHASSEDKVLASLQQFGLDKNLLPTEVGGNIVLDNAKWMAELKQAGK